MLQVQVTPMEVLIAACLTYSFLIGSCGCVNEWLRDGVLARGEREREREGERERESAFACNYDSTRG